MNKQQGKTVRVGLVFAIAIGLVGWLTVFGSEQDVAEARLQMIMEGTVVADPDIGPLIVNFLEYTGVDPCVDGVLPEEVDEADLQLGGYVFLQAGGEWFDQRLFSYGPWVVQVEDSTDASVFQYFAPFDDSLQVYGDESQIGCFDYFDGSYYRQWMHVGVLMIV
ncbi:MAG: hypothetical protein FWG16_05250, partial [Micrococcales bacterium]|nr:hypothetical protein [Micrococcales bacterium]